MVFSITPFFHSPFFAGTAGSNKILKEGASVLYECGFAGRILFPYLR